MKAGTCWEATCDSCDHANETVWQDEAPAHTPKPCGWCLAPGEMMHWVKTVVKPIGYMRLSGFSTSDSDFTPHWNRAFGKRVGSLAEMKALQQKHGVMDAVVKGNGLERHAPRDILRRVKRHNETREAIESGRPIDAGKGVKVEFKGDE
jgi:hypothetical protein